MKELKLTLKKEPFEIMITGEKRVEFRTDTDWIRSRLRTQNGTARTYEAVRFTNGYGKDKPYFVCKFLHSFFSRVEKLKYKNGLEIPTGEYWQIVLGDVIETGNIRP